MVVLDANLQRSGPSAAQLAALAMPLRPPNVDTNPALPTPQRAPWVAFGLDAHPAPQKPYAWGAVAPREDAEVRPSVYANQAIAKITSFQLDHEAATTGTLILATAAYGCQSGGFFGDGCNISIRWLIQAADGSVLLDERRPPKGDWVNAPVNSGQTDQQSFTMPRQDVNVTVQLIQARSDVTSLFGQLGPGEQVADQRTIAVQWAPTSSAAAEQQGRRGAQDFNAALQQAFAAVSPYLPVLVIGGLAIGALILAAPAATDIIHGRGGAAA